MIFPCSFLFSHSKTQILQENLTNFVKNSWTPQGSWGSLFQLQGPLALGGVRVPPSTNGSGEQDCRGKVKGRGFVKPWSIFEKLIYP